VQNLVPQFILEKYIQRQMSGHFAGVSLFADISGFTTVTNALMQHGYEAAETMADIMSAIFGPLVQYVHAYGGFIATFAGDAFTALFPIAEDGDNYMQALAAASSIQQYMAANPTRVTPYGNFPFTIKLGLGDGEVEWGILLPKDSGVSLEDTAVKAAYFFSGPAVEAAAIAEHHAQSGNLILTPTVYERVQSFIKVVPIGGGDERHSRLLSADGLPSRLPAALSSLRVISEQIACEQAFIPTNILERTTNGDFRHVVSVFLKLMGIETGQDLALFMQSVFALQEQFGGYLNLVDFGDKGCNILLCWGMPASFENDIERALDFVLELGNHTPGTFRAGITYRPMYAGLAGSSDRGEFTCYGDGINLAARLMIAAP
jgi:class 3 adenylate cyclase